MSAIYVLPVDPAAPSAAAAAPAPVDAAALWQSAPAGPKPPAAGAAHVFFGAGGSHTAAVASLGPAFAAKRGDARREAVRKAVGGAVKKVRDLGEGVRGKSVLVADAGDAHAAGAFLSVLGFGEGCSRGHSGRGAPGAVQVFAQDELWDVCL